MDRVCLKSKTKNLKEINIDNDYGDVFIIVKQKEHLENILMTIPF